MKKFAGLSLVVLILSCSSSQQLQTNPQVEMHESVHKEYMEQEMMSQENQTLARSIQGKYSGEIPCADCNAILYNLQLFPDLMYRSELVYRGKSDEKYISSGKYSVLQNKVLKLENAPHAMNYLKVRGDELLVLDKHGLVISGDLADLYILKPANHKQTMENKEGTPNFLIDKFQRGIDFYASGNEPFWNLEMDFEGQIHFNTLNGIDFKCPPVEPVKVVDEEVMRYRAVTESGEILIQITAGPCADTMADTSFDNTVTIDFKTAKETDFTNFTGCGDYVPDFRLHDIWAIEEVDGIKVDPADFSTKFPQIELKVYDKQVLGNDGCNSFSGGVRFNPGKITFGNMASTMMACFENEKISFAITQNLQGTLDYSLQDNHLILYRNEKKVMVLKHID